MDRISSLLGIVLKSITIICIIMLTYFYWQNKDSGKYAANPSNYGIQLINTQTGEISVISSEGNQMIKTSIKPFTPDTNSIIVKTVFNKKFPD